MTADLSSTDSPSESAKENLTKRPIYVVIGTKAQYIKTAPLLRLMQEQHVPYTLIDTGQHAEFSQELRRELDVKEPDIKLSSSGDIKTVTEAAKWFLKHLATALIRPQILKSTIFGKGPGLCIIHGDTPSTLLGLILAKRAGMTLVHLEAGLRSYNLFRPFPEELIRIICMKHCDLLFAPSVWAFKNLESMKLKAKKYTLPQNTNVEALHYSISKKDTLPNNTLDYCVFTVHRVETIMNKNRLKFVFDAIDRFSKHLAVYFILHPPTKKKLVEHNMLQDIRMMDNVKLFELLPHSTFTSLIANSSCVVTDGGSIQEESFYLDVPCLLLRKETERLEGMDNNVILCSFDQSKLLQFLEIFPTLRSGRATKDESPSQIILKVLLELAQH